MCDDPADGGNARYMIRKAPPLRHMTQRRSFAGPRSDLRSITSIDDPRIARAMWSAVPRAP